MAKRTPEELHGKQRKRRTTRSRRTDDEGRLWANVLRECEVEFQSTFGVRWKRPLAALGKFDPSLEREARGIYQRLRYALNEAVEFVQRRTTVENRWGNPVVIMLLNHVPERIAPIARQSWLTHHKLPPILADRARLVTILDDYDLFGIPKLPNGSSRFFNAREMALVSLLAGNRPALDKYPLEYTPAQIIKLEVSYMRPLLKKHGRNGITDDDRGPLAGTRPGRADDTALAGFGDLPLVAPFGEGEK